jgi:hypothetical protein
MLRVSEVVEEVDSIRVFTDEDDEIYMSPKEALFFGSRLVYLAHKIADVQDVSLMD